MEVVESRFNGRQLLSRIQEFYSRKRVLITGNTGFKGSWMTMLLKRFGAEVYGYALPPDSQPSLYEILGLNNVEWMQQRFADIREYSELERAFCDISPDVVFHLAAQPIVLEGYKNPRETYEINVMGTVNLLECMRKHPGIKSFLNVTTDKVYKNPEAYDYAFKEEDYLDGYDPYSNSKSCSELVTGAYVRSFFSGDALLNVSTARAGNVIGGGDFAENRIIPDCVRATLENELIVVRNPDSIRPYQHVLEPLMAYLTIVMRQTEEPNKAGCYNIGPDINDCINTGQIVECFCRFWGEPASWITRKEDQSPHEAGLLRLDSERIKNTFGLHPIWKVEEAVEKTVQWYCAWKDGKNMMACTNKQI